MFLALYNPIRRGSYKSNSDRQNNSGRQNTGRHFTMKYASLGRRGKGEKWNGLAEELFFQEVLNSIEGAQD